MINEYSEANNSGQSQETTMIRKHVGNKKGAKTNSRELKCIVPLLFCPVMAWCYIIVQPPFFKGGPRKRSDMTCSCFSLMASGTFVENSMVIIFKTALIAL